MSNEDLIAEAAKMDVSTEPGVLINMVEELANALERAEADKVWMKAEAKSVQASMKAIIEACGEREPSDVE